MTLKLLSDATGGRIQNETPIDVLTVGAGGVITLPGNLLLPAGVLKAGTSKKTTFHAFRSSAQAITINAYTKIAFDQAPLNPNTGYSIANSRFQPDVAGWYNVYATASQTGTNPTDNAQVAIYKNNGSHRTIGLLNASSSIFIVSAMSGSSLVYMNGSSDYIEIFVYRGQASGTASINGDAGGTGTFFGASLVVPD